MHEALQAQVQATAADLQALEEKQHPVREAILAALAKLDAEARPLRNKLHELEQDLKNKKAHTIGPWQIVGKKENWRSGILRVYGGSDEWYTRRVWLRVVLKDWTATKGHKAEWQADIDSLDGTKRIILNLGAPTNDPPADFAAHQHTVEKKCQELGYIIAQEGE